MPEIKSLSPPALLIDAEERHRLYLERFEIPALEVRIAGQVGFLAKIGFEHPEYGGERFWVEIVEVREDGQYVGRVDNDLEDYWEINFNDLFLFEPKHIMDAK